MSSFNHHYHLGETTWEEFLSHHPQANFLQSWNYSTCFEALGQRVFRLGIFDENQLVAVAAIVKEEAKRGTFLSIAGGPIMDWQRLELVEYMTRVLSTLAKQEHAVFVRLRPQEETDAYYNQPLNHLGWYLSPVNLEAEHTLILDLTKTDNMLLAEMKKNHRYELRKAQKLAITTRISSQEKDLNRFCKYQRWLGKRHGYVPFPQRFLTAQFQALKQDDQVCLIEAVLNAQLLASAFVIFYNGEAAYHYGISTQANAQLPGAYACQWAVIQEARNRGMKTYNLWGGLVPTGIKNHRYARVDLFKRGFGGREVHYVPAHDLPVSLKYWGVRGFEYLRKKIRRL